MNIFCRNLVKIRFLNKNKTAIKTFSIFGNSYLLNSSKESQKAEDMDQLKNNPYFEKYKSKIKSVYDSDPVAFEDTLKSLDKTVLSSDKKQSDGANYSLTKERKLDSIMKIEMLSDLGIDDVKQIWTSYHEQRSKLSSTLDADEYSIIEERSKKHRTFVYALPRANKGYEFILAQWLNNECHFTPLINFQAHGENAPSIMTVIFFRDLIQSKNISLVMGEVDDKMCPLNDAKFLYNQLILYYLKPNDEKLQLLESFTKTPEKFKHMDVIKQLEKDNLTKIDDNEVKK